MSMVPLQWISTLLRAFLFDGTVAGPFSEKPEARIVDRCRTALYNPKGARLSWVFFQR